MQAVLCFIAFHKSFMPLTFASSGAYGTVMAAGQLGLLHMLWLLWELGL